MDCSPTSRREDYETHTGGRPGSGVRNVRDPDKTQPDHDSPPALQKNFPITRMFARVAYPSPLPLSRKGRGESPLHARICITELYGAAPFLLPLREKDRMRGKPHAQTSWAPEKFSPSANPLRPGPG